MEPKDISTEEWREYTLFQTNKDGKLQTCMYRIEKPLQLFVAASGSHRVVASDGITHYIPAGYFAIRWYAPKEPVSF